MIKNNIIYFLIKINISLNLKKNGKELENKDNKAIKTSQKRQNR